MIKDFWKKNVKVGQCVKRESCSETSSESNKLMTHYSTFWHFRHVFGYFHH